MAGTEVAERASNLPAQRYDAASELGAEDVPFPRMKFAQKTGDLVDAELVNYGSIFTQIGQGDAEPQTLVANPDKEVGTKTDAVRFYVLGVRTGFSWRDPDDNFVRSQFAPGAQEVARIEAAGNRVDKTYDYTIALPEHDADMPYRFLMTGAWGGPAARLLNLMLKKASAIGPSSEVPFEVRAVKDKNRKGFYARAEVNRAKVPARQLSKDLEIVRNLESLVQGRPSLEDEVINAEVVDAPEV